MAKLRIGTRRPWSEVRLVVESRLAAFPGLELTVDDEPAIAWHDGPGETTLSGALGELPGWRLVLALDHPDPEAEDAGKDRRQPVWIRRSFSDQALAVAVVRYQASHVRPYDSTRSGAEAALRDVLDIDDPTVSGYPLTDAMAALLLAAPDADGPADIAGTTPADDWSRRLAAVGYDHLWNAAYAHATL